MAKRMKSIALGIASAVLVLAMVLGSAIPVAQGEPAQKVVKIGMCGAFTGPIAPVAGPWNEGIVDYTRYINEQGGIDGIKLEVIWYETGRSITKSIIAHRRFLGAGVVLEHIGSTVADAMATTFQRDEIPATCLNALSPGQITKPMWIFNSFTDWPTAFTMTVKWIKENLWTEARPMRVGAIGYDHHSFWCGLDGTKYFDRVGAEFVGREVVPVAGCVDTSVELLRLAGKKVDWLYLTSYGASTVTIIKDAARLEIQQKGIGLVAAPNTLDECTLVVVMKDANGWYSGKITPNPTETERLPGLVTLCEKAKEYRGYDVEKVKGFYIAGWLHQAAAVEAIRLAIEKVGYENLTGRAVREAMVSIRDFDTGFFYPMTITESAPFITTSFGMYQVKEVNFEPIEYLEPLPSLYMTPEEFLRAL